MKNGLLLAALWPYVHRGMSTTTIQPRRDALVEVDRPLLQEIVRKIVERFRPRRILLFGSRARGDFRSDSDVDLFIEMESSDAPHERKCKIRALFPDRRWGLDLVVYTPAEVAKYRPMRGLLLSMIEGEGQGLYEQAPSRG